jgi:hypothetical protein
MAKACAVGNPVFSRISRLTAFINADYGKEHS